MIVRTLVFLYKPEEKQLLLAMKKRGFGEGRWNGVGGKVHEGEMIEEGAVREAQEEIGVRIAPEDLEHRGVITFSLEEHDEPPFDVHVYFVSRWEGEPTESEEMRPAWYAYDAVPYEEMWVDDARWLPHVLAGKLITARFHLGKDGSGILSEKIEVREV